MRRYDTVSDLPFVYRYHLPLSALELFREEYNQALKQHAPRRDRDLIAREHAIAAVKARYAKDPFGVWRERGEGGA